MKIFPVIICAAVCASMLTACGKDKEKGDGTGHMYNASLIGNPKSLDPQYADDPSSNTVIRNLYSGLMQMDSSGKLTCCNAESYDVSEDGLTYTFRLRQDNYWFLDYDGSDTVDEGEYFPVTADDYVFALQRVLDPNMQSPYGGSFICIKGGEAALSGAASPETIGVEAVDAYTLEITLEYPSAEFLTLLSTSAAYPCNRDFFYSTKGRYGLDDKSVMSNGAFFVRQWFFDPYGVNNILYMKANSANDCENYQVLPSYLSFSIEESEKAVRELFKESEIDCFATLSNSYSTKKYSVSGSMATTLGLIFNPEDKTYSNQNLRTALALSVDREAVRSKLSNDVTTAYGIIPPAVTLTGRSYRELSSDKAFDEYNTENALMYYKRAKNDLNAESFDTVKILVSTDSIDSGYLHLISQQWQEVLGCYIGIEEVTAEEFESRLENGEYSIALYPLKADFNSGVSVLGRFEEIPCLANAGGSAAITDSVRRCVNASGLVAEYTAAEKEILGEYGFIPLFYKKSYLVAGDENEDIILDPFAEAVDFRIAQNYD